MNENWETFKVKGDELLSKLKQLLHEGNVRRIVIKHSSGTVAEFPLAVGIVGAVGAPALAAIGALAALLTRCTIEVERTVDRAKPQPARKRPARRPAARGAKTKRA